jgi:hypothetical protein
MELGRSRVISKNQVHKKYDGRKRFGILNIIDLI